MQLLARRYRIAGMFMEGMSGVFCAAEQLERAMQRKLPDVKVSYELGHPWFFVASSEKYSPCCWQATVSDPLPPLFFFLVFFCLVTEIPRQLWYSNNRMVAPVDSHALRQADDDHQTSRGAEDLE